MSDNFAKTTPALDPALLAKLTGGLGDSGTVGRLSAALGNVYSTFLSDIVKGDTGLDIAVGYVGCQTGMMGDLVAGLKQHHALVDGSLRNWSPNFVLACGSGFIMTLMEHMLGAAADTIEAPILRPLSVIELDVAVSLFEQLASVLKSGVNAAGGFEPMLEAPRNIEDRPKAAQDYPQEFAIAIKMSIALGKSVAEFSVIVPQKTLLKTTIATPKPKNQSTVSQDWTDQIGEQVRRSQVTLEARVRLQSLKLGEISKLAVGDVIPFMDSNDVRVEVSANGKDLYICEFGRSGENYTVRVKDNINSEDELLKHLMN